MLHDVSPRFCFGRRELRRSVLLRAKSALWGAALVVSACTSAKNDEYEPLPVEENGGQSALGSAGAGATPVKIENGGASAVETDGAGASSLGGSGQDDAAGDTSSAAAGTAAGDTADTAGAGQMAMAGRPQMGRPGQMQQAAPDYTPNPDNDPQCFAEFPGVTDDAAEPMTGCSLLNDVCDYTDGECSCGELLAGGVWTCTSSAPAGNGGFVGGGMGGGRAGAGNLGGMGGASAVDDTSSDAGPGFTEGDASAPIPTMDVDSGVVAPDPVDAGDSTVDAG